MLLLCPLKKRIVLTENNLSKNKMDVSTETEFEDDFGCGETNILNGFTETSCL
jgi:hypothetical protein